MKKILSLFLCLIMLFSLLPISALAKEEKQENEETSGNENIETLEEVREDNKEESIPGDDDEKNPSPETVPEESKEPVVPEEPTAPEEPTIPEEPVGTVEDDEDNEDDEDEGYSEDDDDWEDDSLGIRISECSISLDAWESWKLYTDCSPDSVTWTSEDPDIASVDEDGMVVACGRGETVITAIAEFADGKTASDECFITVLSDGFLAECPEDLQSGHPYEPGANAIWQYSLPGAEELLVSFDDETCLGEGGFLLLADGDGEAFLRDDGGQMSFAGAQLAGQSLRLPGDTFRIYLYSDAEAEEGWGFAVTDVRAYMEEEELEEENGILPEEAEAAKESENRDAAKETDEEEERENVPIIGMRREEVIPQAKSFGPKTQLTSLGVNAALSAPTPEPEASGDASLRAVPPTATIVVMPGEVTMDALTERALIASVTVPEETGLDGLSIEWKTDSDRITITDKNMTLNPDAHTLTGTATVLSGNQRTDTPAVVTATVMYTAGDGTDPVEVKTAESETAEASCEVTVGSGAIVVTDWHQLESAHNYAPNTHCFWEYTDPDPMVKSITLSFDSRTETVSPRDTIRVSDGAGRPAGIYTGMLLSGQSVTVNSRTVRIYLDSEENSECAWGFKVINCKTVKTTDPPRYSVRYYANGGIDAPKDQPQQELPLTLSESKPVREHYTFKGWATDRDSGVTYQPGEIIETLDPNTLIGSRLDLFAAWERVPTYNDDNRGVTGSSYAGPSTNSVQETKSTPANPILVERPETEYDKDVLHIRTVEDLLTFAENCSLDTWSDRLPVVLDNDLSLSGVDFWAVPIFNGCFDGRNHTIYDVSLTDAMAPCGFFLELGRNATVKNLNVVGSVTPGGENNMTGGLVGVNRGLLSNCSFSGTVAGTQDTGGIAGRNEATGILSGCRSLATVTGLNATGGIAGHNCGAIIACESSCFVNIDSVDPALNIQSIDTSSILNFIESLGSDTVGVTTDTGGIVGFNEGFIETCIARETVGYQHLGYNVGGIAGHSDGYIGTCLNEADVYGRRDVGGILGQAEPYIELKEDNSIIAGLSYRVYALHSSIRAAANDAEVLGDDIAGQLSDLSGYVLPLERALFEFDINDPTVEALENIREAIRNMVSGVSGELESMGASVDEGSSVLADDLNSISDNISALSGTAIQSAQLISSSRKNTVLEDISVSEAESELTLGKTSGCTNRGDVNGDNNVGGIVGCMSIENELDPESDLTNSDFLARKQNRYRIVVAECLNDGPVTAKKECVGGIAGRADIGYIARSVAYNHIALEDGDYAGGIAGLLYGTVGACVAKCSLAGSKYVGGVVGNGRASSNPDDKPSLVSNCYTLVDIHNRPQFSGAVSGGGEGSYKENYFVPSGYAGINRLSVQGQAEPVLFSVFSSLDGLPDESKHFTLRFVVEGETVREIPFEYGASFGRSVFPDLPMKDGAYVVWDRTELTDLRFDTVVTGEYRRSETALKSDLCREDGRPAGYVIGQFQQGDSLQMELIPVEDAEIENFRLSWRQAAMEQLHSVLNGSPDYSIPMSVLEHAVFRFPDDGLELHTLRYLSPNGQTENIRVYQKSGDGWQRLQPESFGSYLSVLSAEDVPELCLVETMQSWWILVWVAGAIAVLILLIVIIHALRKMLKSRAAKRKEAAADSAEKPEAEGKQRKAVRRRKLLLILAVVLAVMLLALTVLLQSGRLQAGISGYRLLRDFCEREADIDSEILIATGDETLNLDSTLHRIKYKDNMINCADQYGIPLYISGSDIYLENGRTFRILSRSLDSSTLVRMMLEAFRSGTINVEQKGDTTRFSTELDADSIPQTLRSLLSEEIEDVLTVDRLRLELTVDGGELSELTFSGGGKRVDGKDFKIDVALRPMPLSERPEVPQAVLNAIDAGGRGTELLTDDFLALLAAWIRYDRADAAEATIAAKANAGLLSLNEQYGYYRRNVDGTDIHCVSNRLFTVYFTDGAACTAGGAELGSAETALMDSARLITAARELCLNGSFTCEKVGSGRVYTMTLDAENVENLIREILPDLAALQVNYDDCALTVTLRSDSLYSLELSCGGTLKVVARDLDASADVIVRITEPKQHKIPAGVIATLLGE